jgi:beta-N-acetylhexosaminidase
VNVSNGHLVQRADPVEAAGMINKLQRLSKVPLLVGADLERGASMRFNDTTIFPQAMAFAAAGDPGAARYEGEVTAREARAIGVNWVFFPDADVNSNPDNPIINIRSYSEDPKQVSEYVDAFLEGASADPHFRVLTTAKHFPGHGDTDIDTHLNMATVTADRKHLDEVELVPFRAAIAKGVDSIMTAHLAVPALGTGDVPATLSPVILTTLLRGDLGFKGIIVTDALDMGGVAKGFSPGDAAVRAIEAGADVLLMPADPVAAINAVVAAVKDGRIAKKRLDESLERVLAAKARVGLNVTRYVNTRAILKVVNLPASNQRAMEIAQHAVTLLKNDYNLVPIRRGSAACFAILRESPSSQEGQAMQPEINRRAPGRPALLLDPGMTDADLDRAVAQAGACDAWYVAAFVSVAGYRGNVSLGGRFPDLIGKLLASGKPVMLLSLGNPYLLRSFPNVSGYLTTFSTVPPSEIAAVQALYGEIPIRGHLPISIPALMKFGDGIALTPVK